MKNQNCGRANKVNKKRWDFIAQHWKLLAANAWREYLLHGRGALVFGALGEPDDYVFMSPEVMAAEPVMRDFARFAWGYEPTRHVVLVFLGVPPFVTVMEGGPPAKGSPPALYERLKGVLQEK
jgi:hypothetical protein